MNIMKLKIAVRTIAELFVIIVLVIVSIVYIPECFSFIGNNYYMPKIYLKVALFFVATAILIIIQIITGVIIVRFSCIILDIKYNKDNKTNGGNIKCQDNV